MPLDKDYLRLKGLCRVRFQLPRDAVPNAGRVVLVGEFNDWNQDATPMERMENGDFRVDLDLPIGSEFQFRYLVDGHRWINDEHADRYQHVSAFNDSNSVVIV